MILNGLYRRLEEVSDAEKSEMFCLMERYYYNVDRQNFERDLSGKNSVIFLLDAFGRLAGFTTQALLNFEIQGRPVCVVFSGDTIVEKKFWNNTMALSIAWGRMMLGILDENPDRLLYWLLTSKGFRTYRFLPVFFKKYYPSPEQGFPDFEKEITLQAADKLFSQGFDPSKMILHASENSQKLKDGIGKISEGRIKDKSIAFFAEKNPGHADGDELLCLAPFSRENLKDFILKRLL
ncbi:MAG: hypothetical protein OEZ34_12130 [Spirochaetia bacterium]|nr:hypothetical protein [Spirochaetia bacterium]